MSYFEKLVPSEVHYFKRFKELDETDLEIIFTMINEGPNGPRNVRKVAKKLNLSQQTVNYRVLRFEHLDLVRFRALVDETSLGLTNYAVIASVKPGLLYENKQGTAVNAGTFLTCYPIWRRLGEVRGGTTNGFFVLYSIPSEGENDLKVFLEELLKIKCIDKIDEFCKVTRSYLNFPSPKLYYDIRKVVAQGRPVSFNWERWAEDFSMAEEAPLLEEPPKKIALSYEDLLILFHLEKNLREKFVDIAKIVGESSVKVAKRYRELLRWGLIKDCRAEIYPIDPVSSMYLVLQLTLTSNEALRKLVSHLNKQPYPITYQKVIGKNTLFLHTMIPPYEYFDFLNAFELLERHQGIIDDIKFYVSSYPEFYNIKLYEAFSKKENKWMFSKEIMLQTLHRLIVDTKFKF